MRFFLFVFCLLPFLVLETAFASEGSLTLTPNKSYYGGNENITVTVTGFNNTTNIQVYWKRADQPMNTTDGWNAITGNYNSTTKTFIGSFSTPNESVEILIAANVVDAAGFYTGNPAFSNCVRGAYGHVVDGHFQADRCHDGFQKFIAIDPLRSQIDQIIAHGGNILNSYIDLKDYLKFEPGYYWEFDGVNFTYNPDEANRFFRSRIEAEKPVIVLNKHRVVPLRFTKNKTSGYIAPKHKYETEDYGWNGPFANRWSVTAFSSDSRWTGFYIGALVGKGYYLSSPNPFSDLGSQSYQGNVYFTDQSQHRYYPPYLVAPRYLPSGNPSDWSFNRKDTIHLVYPDQPSTDLRLLDQNENYNDTGHGWIAEYGWENVQTPIYTGKALRMKFQESDGRLPEVSGFLREDWFFAPNIGFVMVREKNFKPGPCDDTCLNRPMPNPELEMKVVRRYIGQSLQASANSTVFRNGDPLVISLSDNYTGYLEISGGFTSNTRSPWVENGQLNFTVDSSLTPGTYHPKFRRFIPQPPPNSNYEVVDPQFANTLPYSNEIELTFVGNAPPPTTNPSPTPICSLPSSPGSVLPSGNFTCGATQINYQWTSVTGVTSYALRVNDTANGWDPNCNVLSGDYCNYETTTTKTLPVIPGHTYSWWVHGCNACGCGPGNSASVYVPLCPPPTSIPLLGDANGDGQVNIIDFALWKTEYLTKNGLTSDFDKNNKVNIIDFALWKTQYLKNKN